jgi:hypothetical protein
MATGHVPTANINALYTNTTAGTTADPNVIDAAIQDIVSTINSNWDEFSGYRITMNAVDGGNFTDSFGITDGIIDGGDF